MGSVISSALLAGCQLSFDPVARSISVEGRRTALDSRSTAVFAALVEAEGAQVSKDALLSAAWPNQVVHENTLAKAISKLRQAIAGSGLEIAAVYGVGYCLRSVADQNPAPAPVLSSRPASTSSRWALFIGIALALFGITAMARYAFADPTAVRTERPTTNDAADAVATILWVDDHPANNRAEIALFRQRRIAVHLAESSADAAKLIGMNDYALIISDLGRGEDRLAGLKMTQALRQRGVTVPVIIYTMRPSDPAGQAAQRKMVADAGASDLALTPAEVRAKVLSRFPL
jgi:DNA-binding response OmpR family regulator